MKITHYIFYIALALSLASCTDDEATVPDVSTSGDPALLGRRVSFSAAMADAFQTRVTRRHDGSFNEGDIMTIYRQYSEDGGTTFRSDTEAWRTYSLLTTYATGTSITLDVDWLPLAGMYGSNTPGTTFTQTDADSLTWDNGKTVRFRSWSRSNLAGAFEYKSKGYYYPDYSISDWVTVSGPTMDIPLTLRHQGCRIGFIPKGGNQLSRAEICTEWEDYLWADNNTDSDHDEAATEHGKTEAQAKAECAQVKAVFDRMCMPSGVDIESSLLTTLTKDLYDATTDFRFISHKTEAEGMVKFGTKTPEYIAENVQHPVFAQNDGRLYLVTVPYDMSNAAGTQGETLRLPACTRIRVWLYDVNDGDRRQTSGEEANYHIFTLSDICKEVTTTDPVTGETVTTEEPLFPDGLELAAGVSYLFSVGYHYNQFTITPADSFSWDEQDAENGVATNEHKGHSNQYTYKWWQEAIEKAIPKSSGESYNPVFHIKTQQEFLEFIRLVNGTATNKTSGYTQVLDPAFDKDTQPTDADYLWFHSGDIDEKGNVRKGAKAVSREAMEEEGYIFYQHYHPANADQAAYAREDYLRGPYSFFDENLNRHFTVCLDRDLDLYDWPLTTIGNETVTLTSSKSHPFRGVFEGNMHKLTNVYMSGAGNYLFGHCFDAVVRNLRIETTHPFQLINVAEANDALSGFGAYVVGVSIKAPATGCPIANKLKGASYVVGCFFEGKATGAMVGEADNLTMLGNMFTGREAGASLLGKYSSGATPFFAPQTTAKVQWGRFMVNYYEEGPLDNHYAVGGTTTDNYRPQEYIRGVFPHVLKAKNDNMLADDVPWEMLKEVTLQKGFYGLAPWKAMNYAIWMWNKSDIGKNNPCLGHYVNNSTGYVHRLPELVEGAPDSDEDATGYRGKYESLNVLEQNN